MIKYIDLVNIQGYRQAHVEFPETGIIRVFGDNSGGKTALFRPLFRLIDGSIFQLSTRKSLIKRGYDFGICEIAFWSGYTVVMLIHLEAASCKLKLIRPDGTSYERALSDKAIPDLLEEIRIHYNTMRNYSLHIYRAQTPPLFSTNNGVINYSALEECLSDTRAITAVEVYKGLLTEWKQHLETVNTNIRILQGRLLSMEIIDEKAEEAKIAQMKDLLSIIEGIYIPNIPEDIESEVDIPQPTVEFSFNGLIRALRDLPPLADTRLEDTNFSLHMYIPQLNMRNAFDSYAKAIQELENEICPTCGQSLGEHREEKHYDVTSS